MSFEKLIKDLKSIAGVQGIAIMNRDCTPVALDGAAESEGALAAFTSTTLKEVAAAFGTGKAQQTLIVGSNYKILIFEFEKNIVSVFMDTAASLQAVKSRISAPQA